MLISATAAQHALPAEEKHRIITNAKGPFKGGMTLYRIFIVGDDPVIVSALCAHMEKWGFECRGVEDFRKVTEEFAAYAPHLVLMDISLPFMTATTGAPRFAS